MVAYDPDIRQLKPVTRPHRHVGEVPEQVPKPQGCSLFAAFNFTNASAVSDRYGATYRSMSPTTAATTSWGIDTGPNVFLHQPGTASHRSTCFSFMDAMPRGSRPRPRYGIVPLAFRHTPELPHC